MTKTVLRLSCFRNYVSVSFFSFLTILTPCFTILRLTAQSTLMDSTFQISFLFIIYFLVNCLLEYGLQRCVSAGQQSESVIHTYIHTYVYIYISILF